MNSLKERYEKEIRKELKEKFNYSSVMEVPKLEKIVINIGVGEASHDSKFIEAAAKDLETITGHYKSKKINRWFQIKRRTKHWY